MSSLASIYRRLIWATVILLAITAIGTIGYWFIGQGKYSVMDAFYMTFITIATIGYGEIVDLSGNPGGRLFTVFISIAGIGVLAYVATNLTAFLVEGELKETFRRRKMESRARKLKGHYIICGLGVVSQHVINELKATSRPFIVLTDDAESAKTGDKLEDEILLVGNASDNDMLLKAGDLTPIVVPPAS